MQPSWEKFAKFIENCSPNLFYPYISIYGKIIVEVIMDDLGRVIWKLFFYWRHNCLLATCLYVYQTLRICLFVCLIAFSCFCKHYFFSIFSISFFELSFFSDSQILKILWKRTGHVQFCHSRVTESTSNSLRDKFHVCWRHI